MKVKDRVVTSKGRFGIIDAISADNTKAMVVMGHKAHEILIKELSVLENIIPINVTYVDKFDVTQEEHTCILNLTKNDIIYSFNPTEQIIFIEKVKLLLNKRLNNYDLLIIKIHLL